MFCHTIFKALLFSLDGKNIGCSPRLEVCVKCRLRKRFNRPSVGADFYLAAQFKFENL